MIRVNPLYVIAIIFIALGSVFLTLLYFKVVSKLFAKDMDVKQEKIAISNYYTVPSYILFILLIVGVYVILKMGLLTTLEIITPSLLIAIVPLLLSRVLFKKAHRVKEYHCGEKEKAELSMYYFDIPQSYKKVITAIAIAAMIILLLGVL